ncbi:DNA-processing protein DprA [Pinirhizobacter soli]|uniref:DNA-processing protein DprA n=1 Tax=Pinirhizobacter soli TaxID=2786953 RepID=UPI002029ECB3|nr:DNA-processing protein DprA [Pinirhizobacter soli]
MADLDNDRAWVLLLRTPGLSASRLRQLLVDAGRSATSALDRVARRPGAYRVAGAGAAWLAAPDEARIEADLAWMAEPGHRLLRCTDEDFPPQLEAITPAPVALWVAGDASLLLRPQVAVIGSRSAGPVGLANARAFARDLTAAGLVVTSGLADGVDGAAHTAALEAGGPTIAVVGTGPDRVYPRKHLALARAIVDQGAMATEFPPGTSARPDHFPRRNRIIAGLSLGTLVIEAGEKSGSLITARFAAEQGREVFAVPGSIHNPLAEGCHQLIADGARLVQRADDVVQVLAPAALELGRELAARLGSAEAAKPRGMAAPAWRDDPDYLRLLAAMGDDPVPLDDLVTRTSLPVTSLASMLLMLELEDIVATLPGNRYQRLPPR